MRIVAAVPAVALIAGSALGLFVPDIPTFIPLVTLVAACATAVVAWRGPSTSLGESAMVVAVAAGFAAGGELLAADAWHKAQASTLRQAFDEAAAIDRANANVERRFVPLDPSAFAVVDGVLRQDASPTPTGVSLSLDVTRVAPFVTPGITREVSGGALVTVAGAMSAGYVDSWRAGRQVRLPVDLHRPSRYLDTGVPDGERALLLRGTTLVGSTKSGALVQVLARGSWIVERLAGVRAFSRRAIHDTVGRWSARSAAIVTAIVIGDRAGLDQSVQQSLQQAGTYHVIAISGGNIAILAGLMLAFFRWAGALGRTASLGSMTILILYGALVGGGASVNRATLMAVVYFAARAADQRSPPLNTLALAAALLVAVQPFSIADPAFVLTFGATLAILLGVHEVRGALKVFKVPRLLLPAVALLVASAATEAVLLPAGALLFSRVTFAGLALNFLAIPLMAVAQIAGMAVVPLALVSSTLAQASGFVASIGAEGLVRSAELVRFAPVLACRVAPPALWVVVLYYVSLAISWTSLRKSVFSAISAISALTALFCALWILIEPWSWLSSRGDGRLHVSFLDVGQGDSAFIRLPQGSTMLVDAGGLVGASTFDIGDRVVAPVLRAAGVRRLDYLVLTHGDPDHIGGAGAIVEEFRPRHIWEGIPVPRFEPVNVLHGAADARGLAWTTVRTGDRLQLDGVTIAVWHPPPPDWERQKVRNDDSIVLELRWRDVSLLLTGDIGRAVERDLTPALSTAPLRVLKVPHHGSLTSSTPEFIRALRPRIAVFSAGRSNHFGHPAQEILERYRLAGVQIFRTDQSGEIDIASDGHSLSVATANHEDTKTTKDTKQ
jgi:competence protein ComEC